MQHMSRSYKIFMGFNYILLLILAVSCLFPLVHLLAISLSSKAAADAFKVTMWPVDFTVSTYKQVMTNGQFIRSFTISALRSLIGPVVSLLIIIMACFSLEKSPRQFKGRNVYMWFFVFSMLFSGGLVPIYMVINNLGLRNNFLVFILPGAVSVYYMILVLNFFRMSIPAGLKDAAAIDGAGNFTSLIRIYIPLSMPVIATIWLFLILDHWNSYFDGYIYMSSVKNYPLATFLQAYNVVTVAQTAANYKDIQQFSNRTIKSAEVFIATVPILLIYPFMQRYFIQGIVVGSIKE